MKWFVILTNPYRKFGPFNDQVAADKFGKSTALPYTVRTYSIQEIIMSLFKKKPVVIEAFKWTGGPDQTEDPEWIVQAIKDRKVWIMRYANSDVHGYTTVLYIETLEGERKAFPGDYIIKGVKGELYPCKPDIFELTYEPAGD